MVGRRLKFWGGMFLIVIVGIGVLAYVTYRKAMCPPSTPPGKSPEFDKHLAKIDDTWLFVFVDMNKLEVADIYGKHVATILDISKFLGEDAGFTLDRWYVSPGRDWAILVCTFHEFLAADTCSGESRLIEYQDILMLSLRDFTIRALIPEEKRLNWMLHCTYWLDETTVLSIVEEIDGNPARLNSEIGSWRVLTFDVENPERFQQVDIIGLMSKPKTIYDEEFSVLFIECPDKTAQSNELMIYDAKGLRKGTEEELRRYEVLMNHGMQETNSSEEGAPKTEVVEKRRAWHLWVEGRTIYDIMLGSQLVRRTRRQPIWDDWEIGRMRGLKKLIWDEDLRLFMWVESDFRQRTTVYYMDTEGHYRVWREGGDYCDKVLRWEGIQTNE